MVEMTPSMNDDELTLFLLALLPSDGYLTIDAIVEECIIKDAATKVNERLEQLEAEGLVKSPKKGQWRLAPK